ncbi:hypothetical protein [uncultured Halomonas sp.]|uniref:class I SAM-dependent methyltransferase n=1 Tax=uncultured Halomonas sp. TaxID=173971 RepID=UPI00262BDE09|nr:hypothetical protein [uncultured Halomonas sp.]
MQDNADLQHKLRLRSRALGNARPRLVLDAFAGEGVITRMLWRHVAGRVICIEKQAGKARCLALGDSVEVVVGDNAQHAALAAEADVIDCDAYGLAMPFIERVAAYARPGALVVFTDGTPVKARKVFSAEREFRQAAERMLRGLHVERAASGTTYYGYGWLR